MSLQARFKYAAVPDEISVAGPADSRTSLVAESVTTETGSGSKNNFRHLLYISALSSFAALGGFLSGYDAGIISGATLFISEAFHLTDFQIELIVSGVIAGAILGAVCAGFLQDKLGRKPVILLASVVFVVGALLMGWAGGFYSLLLGRVIAGIGVGLSGGVVPVYVSEIVSSSRCLLSRYTSFTPINYLGTS